MTKIRRAWASALGFYSSTSTSKEIETAFLSKHGVGEKVKLSKDGKRNIIGAVVPHAGYVFSGPVAAHVYHSLAKDGEPQVFVILGPSHQGYPGFCVMQEGIWRTPMGDVYVDSDLAKAIVKHSEYVDINPEAHEREHSIEVQLPFLQYLYNSKFKIVPITVGPSDYEMCEDVGKAIAKAKKEQNVDAVVIGSTDFTHYGATYGYAPVGTSSFEEVLKWVNKVDHSLIDIILEMNGKKLFETVTEKRYTMCGSVAVATMITAAKELGAKKAKLLKYATSYGTGGSKEAIVGYGAIILTNET
jgi:AmmeMemoRadiSam system protein B